MGPRPALDGCGESHPPQRDSIPGSSSQERVAIPTAKNNGCFTQIPLNAYDDFPEFLLEREILQAQVVETVRTHISCSLITPLPPLPSCCL